MVVDGKDEAGDARGRRVCTRGVVVGSSSRPTDEAPPSLHDTKAVVGPAPPVYDPGGTTALALETDAAEVDAYDRWAAASGAVLAIAAARSTEPELEDALQRAGYEVASDWFAKALGETDQAAA